MKSDNLAGYLKEVEKELKQAQANFPAFNSAHEGYAAIKEELDELWDKIKANATYDEMEEEAIQIAAMALRFLMDVEGPSAERED